MAGRGGESAQGGGSGVGDSRLGKVAEGQADCIDLTAEDHEPAKDRRCGEEDVRASKARRLESGGIRRQNAGVFSRADVGADGGIACSDGSSDGNSSVTCSTSADVQGIRASVILGAAAPKAPGKSALPDVEHDHGNRRFVLKLSSLHGAQAVGDDGDDEALLTYSMRKRGSQKVLRGVVCWCRNPGCLR